MKFALTSLSGFVWSGVCLLFSLLIISSFWPGIAGIPVAIVLTVMALRRSKALAMLWLAGIPTIFIYANNLLSSVPFLRAERALLPLLVVILLSRDRIRKVIRMPLLDIEKAMLALLFVAGVSMVWASLGVPVEVLHQNIWMYTESLLVPFFGFFFARRQVWNARDINALIDGLLVAAVYLAVVGALQLFLGMSFFYPHYIEPAVDPTRASGVFSSPNQYGFVMMVFCFLAIYRYVRCRDGVARTVLLGLVALALFGVAICKTRDPWLATVAGLGCIYLNDKRVRGVMRIGAVLAFVGGIVALPFLFDSGLLEHRILDLEPMYPRFGAYTTSLNIIAHRPLTGLGFGPFTFSLAKAEYGTTFGLISTNWLLYASIPHNEYLHMMVLMGLAGFIPFMMVLQRAYRLTKAPSVDPDSELAGWLPEFTIYVRAILVAYVVAGLFVDVIMFQYFVLLMYFLLGICASGERGAATERVNGQRPARHARQVGLSPAVTNERMPS